MALGPLEIVVVTFPSTEPGDRVARALARTELQGDLRVIDLLLVSKAADGELNAVDVSDIESIGDLAADLVAQEMLGLLTEEDIAEIGELLDPGSSAVAILVEHLWAAGLARDFRAHGGEMVASIRIPPEQVEAAEEALVEMGALDEEAGSAARS